MVLDILSPLLIYLLVANIFDNQKIVNYLVLFIFAILIVTLQPQYWERVHWSKSYFAVKLPPTIDLHQQSVVLNADYGVSFLRPFFPGEWHFISVGIPGCDLP